MNEYGQMAMEHWRKYRPTEYAQMTGRETFFRQLGDEIERRIEDRAEELEQAVPPDVPFETRLQRMTAARVDAKYEVLREMLPRAEDDETGQ